MFRHQFKQRIVMFKIFLAHRFREIAGALEEALSDTLEEAPGKLFLQKYLL